MESLRMPTPESNTSKRAATLPVNELYASIQGESSYAGRLCSFVRLTGCPLRCVWCDSEFAFADGKRMTIDEIVDEVSKLGIPLVEVTGGEPLAHPGCFELLTRLCDAKLSVLLETSGAIDVAPVDPRVIKILDIKCPGSGMADRNIWENLIHLTPADEIKFVLADRADYEWARHIIERNPVLRDGRPVHFSPVHGQLDPGQLGDWIIVDKLPVRLQIQLHKYAWPTRNRLV